MKNINEKLLSRIVLVFDLLFILIFLKQKIDNGGKIMNYLWNNLIIILIVISTLYLILSYIFRKLYINKTIMKYILFKLRYDGLFDGNNISLESINLPKEFSDKEINILVSEKLIRLKIE